MDPRPELWSPGITKFDFNYYTEFVDMTCGNGQDAWDYMKKYDFDYIIANTDTDLHKFLIDDENQDEYEIVTSGNEYNLWKKKNIVNEPIATYEISSENR